MRLNVHSTHPRASVQVDTVARAVTAEITGLWHRVPGLPRGALCHASVRQYDHD
jgi:hypothetical protein